MLAAEACLVDGERAARISGSASPSRLGGVQQPREVVRSVATSGWSPRSLPRRWRARGASSGSASAQPVWCLAATRRRLLRADRDVGCSPPKLASSMASARRISGSARPAVGGLQQTKASVEVRRGAGIVRAHGLLRDRTGARNSGVGREETGPWPQTAWRACPSGGPRSGDASASAHSPPSRPACVPRSSLIQERTSIGSPAKRIVHPAKRLNQPRAGHPPRASSPRLVNVLSTSRVHQKVPPSGSRVTSDRGRQDRPAAATGSSPSTPGNRHFQQELRRPIGARRRRRSSRCRPAAVS